MQLGDGGRRIQNDLKKLGVLPTIANENEKDDQHVRNFLQKKERLGREKRLNVGLMQIVMRGVQDGETLMRVHVLTRKRLKNDGSPN